MQLVLKEIYLILKYNSYIIKMEIPRTKKYNWFIKQINSLIDEANRTNNSSLIIYACFEMRNFFEQIEYSLVTLAIGEEKWEHNKNLFEKIKGIENVFKKSDDDSSIKKTIGKYLSFLSVLMESAKLPYQPICYSFDDAQKLKNELNSYCHLYMRTNDDFIYNSNYINSGKRTINNCFAYLNKCKIITENGVVLVGVEINTFSSSMRTIYENWQSDIINSKEDLKSAILEVNRIEYNNERYKDLGMQKDFRFGI